MSAAEAAHGLIRADKLTKRFRRVEAVCGLDIDVPADSTYALVGPNGAGKTTTIKTMMNILRPTSGCVEVLGKDSRKLAGTDFEAIGYVSENQKMPGWMCVGDLLAYVRPFYPSWDRKFELELVRKLSLPLDRKLRQLSRGMRIKAALASSLAYRPKLIVLDEPFTGLDPLMRDELVQSLTNRQWNSTVFVSSHDLAEIEAFSTHVGYVESGKVLFSEPLQVLSERFRTVEVVLEAAVQRREAWPQTWMQVEASGHVLQFVESRFDSASTPELIGTELGGVRQIKFAPMSLRSIFLTIARSHNVREETRP